MIASAENTHIYPVEDEMSDEENGILCWLRVRPHHYGLFIDFFSSKPTFDTEDKQAFARLDVDAFDNKARVAIFPKELFMEEGDPEVDLVTIEPDIARYAQKNMKFVAR